MPVGTIDFPELRNPGRVNPINEALGAAMDAYYAPQERRAGIGLKQAETNSKNAYANFTPAQISATLLSTPAVTNNMQPETINKLREYAENALNRGVNNQGYGQNQPSILDNFLHGIGLGGSSTNAPQSSSAPAASPSTEQGSSAPSTQPQNGTTGLPDSPFSRTAAANTVPGSAGGVNAASTGEAANAAIKAEATGTANAYTDQWKAREDENRSIAERETNGMINGDKLNNAYQEMSKYEKGSFNGKWFGRAKEALGLQSTESQIFTQARDALSTSISQGLSNGNITKEQAEMGQALKGISQESNPETVHNLTAFNHMVRARNLQKIPFSLKAKNAGLSPTESDLLFYRYANESPFWDGKKNQPLVKNMNFDKYFSPKMIAWAKNPDSIDYLPKELRENTADENAYNAPYPEANSQPTPGETYRKEQAKLDPLVRVTAPDGKTTGTVPQSQLEDYLANGYTKI